jgi:hypothetical protein
MIAAVTLVLQPVAAFHPQAQAQPYGRATTTRTTTTRRSSASPSAPTTVVDTRESATRDVASMEAWAAQSGAQRSPAVQLEHSGSGDWSALTKEALAANSPLLVIPSDMILSSARAQSELAGHVDEAVNQLGRMGAGDSLPEFYLLVKILTEYERGPASPWFAWFNALPRLFFNACSMTDFCYECLPPLVFSLARGERVKVDNFYDALQKVSILSPATKANKELVKWAYNILSTRSWGAAVDAADIKIVPLADMVRIRIRKPARHWLSDTCVCVCVCVFTRLQTR